ncbi:MAG TPA: hypothetical protein GX530_03145 [Corynebacteriales bacterium]|nr:hypothetical protein [Mycobacteriales bacterium]
MSLKYDTSVFRQAGYISGDGVEVTYDEDTQEYIPWQELNAIREDITKSVKQLSFTLWEQSKENLAWFLGVPEEDIEEVDGAIILREGAVPEFKRQMIVLDVIDGKSRMRLIIGDGQISARENLVIKRGEAFGLGITITVYPASRVHYDDPKIEGTTVTWVVSNSWVGGDATSTADTSVLSVSTQNLANATKGTSYNRTLAATGGTSPYTWKTTAGTLPAGITLSGQGVLSGTPSAVGKKTFTVEVTDSKNATARKELSLEVVDA